MIKATKRKKQKKIKMEKVDERHYFKKKERIIENGFTLGRQLSYI